MSTRERRSDATRTLDQIPVSELKGVGDALATRLARLGLNSLQDLLFHLPLRYEDRSRVSSIVSLRAGDLTQVDGEVVRNEVVGGRRRSLELALRDDTGIVTVRFFYFSGAQQRQLAIGSRVRCFGEVRLGRNGLEFYHPELKALRGDVAPVAEEQFTPVYPLTEGLPQRKVRDLCGHALSWLARYPLRECLPVAVRQRWRLPDINDALRTLHAPSLDTNLAALTEFEHPAQQRLILEELLAHHLSLLRLRHQAQVLRAPVLRAPMTLRQALLASLPFPLTAAQQRVIAEIDADLCLPRPMLRLVQGDVGAGKTLVAAMAALQAVAAGYQVAVMAPTEILAEQHFHSFSRWCAPLGVAVAWLAGKTRVAERRQRLADMADGTARIVVGTHALFQDDVTFDRLGLVVIDEQHRFGVHQRLALRQKGVGAEGLPHQLIMTATPIPRTLAMSAYADLDTSVIDELPPGRQPIETVAVPDLRRDEVIERVSAACQQGRQAYWVCTLIEESEALDCQAAEVTAAMLAERLRGVAVGLVHGRMKPADKAAVMAAFAAGAIGLLVATTVIEVGVDVPNATLIVIENPERLGLAQLHQLRGRVGRGSAASYCVLMYHSPLGEGARQRLAVMRETQDGFVIAERDLQLRGPGEVLGTRQTGMLRFRIAEFERDQAWVEEIRQIATLFPTDSPHSRQLMARWIGEAMQFGQV